MLGDAAFAEGHSPQVVFVFAVAAEAIAFGEAAATCAGEVAFGPARQRRLAAESAIHGRRLFAALGDAVPTPAIPPAAATTKLIARETAGEAATAEVALGPIFQGLATSQQPFDRRRALAAAVHAASAPHILFCLASAAEATCVQAALDARVAIIPGGPGLGTPATAQQSVSQRRPLTLFGNAGVMGFILFVLTQAAEAVALGPAVAASSVEATFGPALGTLRTLQSAMDNGDFLTGPCDAAAVGLAVVLLTNATKLIAFLPAARAPAVVSAFGPALGTLATSQVAIERRHPLAAARHTALDRPRAAVHRREHTRAAELAAFGVTAATAAAIIAITPARPARQTSRTPQTTAAIDRALAALVDAAL